MKNLVSLNKYFWKYKWRLLLGMLFVGISNFFAAKPAAIVREVIDDIQHSMSKGTLSNDAQDAIIHQVVMTGLLLLGLALLRGLFMFFMRQTIIVMSRLIEFDQKNEIFQHYQQLHTHFFKTHFTGDLMNRISEDVSRVRMYTGPSIMYATNLTVLTAICIWNMFHVNVLLTLCVLFPLPVLAFTIYFVNSIIYRKSEQIQNQLSGLTSTAQESYSGIRVIKSFVQEKNMLGFFNKTSDAYKDSAINLSMTEAIYFPAMNFFIGLSMLCTVLVGGYFAIKGTVSAGNIAEFVIYINLLMFPISSIGWVASMIQRASASQKRINEFLETETEIKNGELDIDENTFQASVIFNKVNFTYPHTGIHALKNFSLAIKPGEKVCIIGKTGSGKSTLAHLLLRMYDVQEGQLMLDAQNIRDYHLKDLRQQIAYAPQDTFLFSDTVFNNIRFGKKDATNEAVKEAARLADFEKNVANLQSSFDTIIGELGVMLSGGQKQRIVLARAFIKNSKLLLIDDCLSAVDAQTEQQIVSNLSEFLIDKTTIIITHRLFASLQFDKIIVMEEGAIAEQGNHESLMELNGQYARLYRHQVHG